MKKIHIAAFSVCALSALSAQAISIEEKAATLANCAAVYSISAQYVEAGGVKDMPENEKQDAIKMFNTMGAAALNAAFKYADQQTMETKFKNYSKVYAQSVSKDGNTKSLGPQLEPCKTLVNSTNK